MERQSKHRILGVLVLIGLVVIMLPFFQTRNELPSETALIKAPPFPDQTIQTQEEPTNAAPIASVESLPVPQPTPAVEPTLASNELAQQNNAINLNQSVINKIEPEPVAEKTQPNVLPEGSVKDVASHDEEKELAAEVKQVTTTEAIHKAAPVKTKTKAHIASKSRRRTIDGYQVLDAADVASIASKAWAVQLGSFKNKTNAIHLVNKLRTKGYRSFMESASSSKNGLTKVLVGPKNKKGDANALASQLESETHMRGIVVSYKPLSL